MLTIPGEEDIYDACSTKSLTGVVKAIAYHEGHKFVAQPVT